MSTTERVNSIGNLTRDPQYRRASIARVDNAMFNARFNELKSSIAIRAQQSIRDLSGLLDDEDDNGKNTTCEYDLSKNVLDYLPNPVITPQTMTAREDIGQATAEMGQSVMAADDNVDKSRKTLLGNSKFLGLQSFNESDRNIDASVRGYGGIDDLDMDPPFTSMFAPNDMRLLALVSHNNMKHSMKQFVIANKNVLKKFRLTGTNTTMSMLREVFGDDPEVVYGPACKSGPLGGDAQLVALAVTSQVGGCIFFIDPMDAHPHSADIECLVRQGNVHNILMLNNPSTAHVCLNSLRIALKMGRMEMFPSFFFDLESPSVEAYKMRQKQVLDSAIGRSPSAEVVTRPFKSAIEPREMQINAAMERANRMSIQNVKISQSTRNLAAIPEPIMMSSSPKPTEDLEDFLVRVDSFRQEKPGLTAIPSDSTDSSVVKKAKKKFLKKLFKIRSNKKD